MKNHTPLNLKNFTTTPNTTPKLVINAIQKLSTQMRNNQQQYYTNSYHNLTQKLEDENLTLKGSLNSLGRKLGVTPPQPTEYQPYNFAEMFRTNILTKLGSAAQTHALENIITTQDNPTIKSVLTEYKHSYPKIKLPTHENVKRIIDRVTRKGVLSSTPTADGTLPLWATDTHYSKVTQENNTITLFLKLPDVGHTTLYFKVPNKERFKHGKVTRPTIYYDKKNILRFGFTFQTTDPVTLPIENVLGVDLGRLVPYVATISNKTSYSPAYLPGKRINVLSKKISNLLSLNENLYHKEQKNILCSHLTKAEVLRAERLRVRSKVSRLKLERAHHIANALTTLALAPKSVIVLEDLSWVSNSKWEQSLTQTAVTDKAIRSGVRVKKVSPRGTSQECPRCNDKVTHSGRSTFCVGCSKKLDRDILGSRNLTRKVNGVLFSKLVQKSLCSDISLVTRLARPVTPGSITNNVYSSWDKQHN